jgi:hypothetical protein
MPEFANEKFTFPDEQELKTGGKIEDELEIEIENDTPVEDRNRQPMPKELVEELENDELEEYDDNVKQKLKQMRKVYHDERREKEAAIREHKEALELARKVLDENNRYKSYISSGEKDFVAAVTSAANYELENAKRSYKDAYDLGDTDKLIDAQQAMQEANMKLAQVKKFKTPTLQDSDNSVQTNYTEPTYQTPAVKPDYKAMSWQDKNQWFGEDKEMTAAALGLHEKLKEDGVIVGSDEYYNALDRTMRKRFSENFYEPEDVKPKSQSTSTKPGTVVASASRSTAPNKIRLKDSQVQIAKKLGLTNEQYARAVLKLEK